MSRSRWLGTVAFVVILTPLRAFAQRPVEVSTQQAATVKGQLATVCGQVASVRLAIRTGGAPTFINFDKPSPDQTFTALIWGIDRPKFAAPPESTFVAGKRVCVTGTVTDFKGKPEIVVHGPDEIRVADRG